MSKSVSVSKPLSLRSMIAISVVLLVLVGLGVYLIQRGLNSVEVALVSKTWPTTEGIITRSSVKVFVSQVKENGRVVPNKKSRSYSPDIEYRYTVQDREITGTRVSIEDASIGTRDSAQSIVSQYPAGMTVKVSYDPRQPSSSVLQPGDWTGTFRWFLPGAGLLLIPLLILRGIWSQPADPNVFEVKADENHRARARLFQGMLMVEEIDHWEPGQIIHIRRARVGFIKSIAGAVIVGLVLGIPLGLLPAIYFLSGRGVVFIAQIYLAVSAVLTVAVAIGLILYGRRREYLLDWSLGSVSWDIGWKHREAPLESIEKLILHVPAVTGQPNPIVDFYTIRAQIQGRTYTLLETNGSGRTWLETRSKLADVVTELAKALNVPWVEKKAQRVK